LAARFAVVLSAAVALSTVGPVRAASAPGAEPPVARTHPSHVGRSPLDRTIRPAVPDPRPPWQSRDRIVYAFDRPLRDVLTVAPDLSQECRRGNFRQRVDLLYRAFGPREQPFGVAYGRGAINLIDVGRRRRDDTVYFFHRQDTGRCTVYTARLEEIRPFFIGP
jgi:hypothetical protein